MYAAVPRIIPACVIAGVVSVGEFIASAFDAGRRFDGFREPEVEHLHRAVVADLDVGRLQIAMDDAQLVRGFQGLRDLLRDRQRVGQRDGPMRDALRERLPLDQFEHQRMRGAAVFEPIDRGDARMIERGEHLRFPAKSRQPVGIGDDGGRQNLQRDVAIEPGVASAIHLAHAAGAEKTNDVVGTEAGAGGQCHWGGVSIRATPLARWDEGV